MKVLWIVNTIFPYPAQQLRRDKTVFGGWLNGLANELRKYDDINLAIATIYNGKELKEFNDGKFIYYLIPGKQLIKYDSKLEKYWREINDKFNPDLVHIHGTEYSHGLAYLNITNTKVITSIQGLVHRIGDLYLANISYKEILKNITLRDIIRRDNLFQSKSRYKKRGVIEKEIIKKSTAIIGRTTWDYANVKAINSNVKYFMANEILREKFYSKVWDIKNIERHCIFVSQGSYPIKGLHYLLKAIYILKETYNYKDIKLYVAGTNIFDNSSFKKRLKRTGYAKYIKSLIEQYNLEENVFFTGLLTEEQMIQNLLKTHVVIIPSIVENESNTLSEAQILGMPTIAAFTGGMTDRIIHNKSGFLYPCIEPAMCAEYIARYFENDDLAIQHGSEARKNALERLEPKKNVENIIKIYNEVLGG